MQISLLTNVTVSNVMYIMIPNCILKMVDGIFYNIFLPQ